MRGSDVGGFLANDVPKFNPWNPFFLLSGRKKFQNIIFLMVMTFLDIFLFL